MLQSQPMQLHTVGAVRVKIVRCHFRFIFLNGSLDKSKYKYSNLHFIQNVVRTSSFSSIQSKILYPYTTCKLLNIQSNILSPDSFNLELRNVCNVASTWENSFCIIHQGNTWFLLMFPFRRNSSPVPEMSDIFLYCIIYC